MRTFIMERVACDCLGHDKAINALQEQVRVMDNLLAFGSGKPQCIAVIVCNEIIEDKRTNSKTLVSLFSAIGTQSLPVTHPRMFVMASLTEGMGTWAFAISIRCPSGKEVVRLENTARFEDTADVIDLVFELRNLLFTEAGRHFVDVIVDGTPLISRSFFVHLRPEGPG